jgi:hypothetical protein
MVVFSVDVVSIICCSKVYIVDYNVDLVSTVYCSRD